MGVVSTTISDFHQYDHNGRKFTLAKLEHARVSWSSENSNLNQLDNLQSLKAAITGETLDLELKQVQERPMTPNAVFFFNINNVPNLQASLEAIESRYAVLSFNKTFKMNADPAKGEIEADSRFRYDPDFLKKEVVPALLNKMLAALEEVATQAIDYSSTEAALQEIQRDTNHLRAFCQDVGLEEQPEGRIFIGELWEVLFQWYLDNGFVEIIIDSKGKENKDWSELLRRGDKVVKGSHLIYQRFSELFPKITKQEDTSTPERKGTFYLTGIGFSGASGANGGAETHSQKASEAGGAVLSTLRLLARQLQNLNLEQQQDLLQQLQDNIGLLAPLAPLLDTVRAAAPLGSTDEPSKTVTVSDSNASAESAPVAIVSNAVGQIGNVTQDNSTKNFPSANQPAFKIGAAVAHADKSRESYNWHGQIVEINDGIAKVYWQERAERKTRGGPILKEKLSNLRLI